MKHREFSFDTFFNHSQRTEKEIPPYAIQIARVVEEWLLNEDLCDADMSNHSYLSQSFPMERSAKRSRIVPTESGSIPDLSGSTPASLGSMAGSPSHAPSMPREPRAEIHVEMTIPPSGRKS